jgi:hypothetical protein
MFYQTIMFIHCARHARVDWGFRTQRAFVADIVVVVIAVKARMPLLLLRMLPWTCRPAVGDLIQGRRTMQQL